MRLLHATGEDDFSLVEHIDDIPPYAILSHTWGPDHEEVTFKDIYKGQGKGKTKPGYNKLRFCAKQAKADRLDYFWIDTCCIDKSSSAELSEAINSMYKWYERSKRCYVYLSDIPCRTLDITRQEVPLDSFLSSRWFTRGWTLQELLAPRTLVFFSANGDLLGYRSTFSEGISHQTQIPRELVENRRPAGSYSVESIIRWIENRKTKREEDAAYSLLGILGVQMPLIYGEGRKRAFARLRLESYRSRHPNPLPEVVERLRKIARWTNTKFSPVLATVFPEYLRRPFEPVVFYLKTFSWLFWVPFGTLLLVGFVSYLQKTSYLHVNAVLMICTALAAVGFAYFVRFFGGWAVLEYGLIALSACAFLWLFLVVSQLNATQQKLLGSAKNCTCFNGTNV